MLIWNRIQTHTRQSVVAFHHYTHQKLSHWAFVLVCAHNFLQLKWHNYVLTGRRGCLHQTTHTNYRTFLKKKMFWIWTISVFTGFGVTPSPLVGAAARSLWHGRLHAGHEPVYEYVHKYLYICDELVILCSSFNMFLLFYWIFDAAHSSSDRRLWYVFIRHVINIGKTKKIQIL